MSPLHSWETEAMSPGQCSELSVEPGLEQEFLSPSFVSLLCEPLPGVSNQSGVSRWHEHHSHGRKLAAGSFTPSRAWPRKVLRYARVLRTGLGAEAGGDLGL